jgi:hypothetical protein
MAPARAGPDTPVPMKPLTREVLIEGLRGAADTDGVRVQDAIGVRRSRDRRHPDAERRGAGIGSGADPRRQPTRGIVVAAPGGAGVDAAAIAAGLVGRGA